MVAISRHARLLAEIHSLTLAMVMRRLDVSSATLDLPDDLLSLLKRSRLGAHPLNEQVQIALAIQLFQEGVISIGKAAQLAGENRVGFESLLAGMGIPCARYELADYEQDIHAIQGFSEAKQPPRE